MQEFLDKLKLWFSKLPIIGKLIVKFWDVFLYVFVGGVATLVEWVVFWFCLQAFGIPQTTPQRWVYIAIAYIISTFANMVLARLLVFRHAKISKLKETILIYIASGIGLSLNLVLMELLLSFILVTSIAAEKTIFEMYAKMIATIIVLAWNFLIRKYYIYRQKSTN